MERESKSNHKSANSAISIDSLNNSANSDDSALSSSRDERNQVGSSRANATNRLIYIGAGTILFLLVLFPVLRTNYFKSSALESRNSPLGDLLGRSESAYNSQRFHEAIAFANEALRIEPKSAEAHNNLAVSYLELWDFKQAMDHARTAIQLSPNLELARNNLAWITSRKATFDAAVEAPKTAEDWVNRSLDRFQKQQHADCMESAQKAIQLDASIAAAYNNFSACSLALGKWDDAAKYATKALNLQPNFELAKNNLAAAIEARKKAEGKLP